MLTRGGRTLLLRHLLHDRYCAKTLLPQTLVQVTAVPFSCAHVHVKDWRTLSTFLSLLPGMLLQTCISSSVVKRSHAIVLEIFTPVRPAIRCVYYWYGN
jgi:hypothetical protein